MHKLLLVLLLLCVSFASNGRNNPGITSAGVLSSDTNIRLIKAGVGRNALAEVIFGSTAQSDKKVNALVIPRFIAPAAKTKRGFFNVPDTPGSITGEQNVCIMATLEYSVVPVQGAESYTWSVPNDWTITGGQGTNTIKLMAGSSSGNITVRAANGSGISAARTLAIQVSTRPPAEPGPINGSVNICPGKVQSYNIGPVAGATGYTWTVPADWQIISGQGSSGIQVISGSDGEISVVALNNCGTSRKKSLTATFNPLYNYDLYTPNLVLCAGYSAGKIFGHPPIGGTGIYTFLWESSTQGETDGFAPAAGVNNGNDYQPEALTQTTWFRRRVISGCFNEYSNVVQIEVVPIANNNAISSQTVAVCAGWAANELVGSTPNGGRRYFTYQWETSTAGPAAGFVPASGINNTKNYIPSPIGQTTWFRRIVSSGCTSLTSNVVKIEVKTQPPTPKIVANAPEVGGTLQLTASSSMAGLRYTWEGPQGFTANVQNPVITNVTEAMTGYYFVWANSEGNDCSSYDSLLVTIKPVRVVTPPTVITGLLPAEACAGTTVSVPFSTSGTFQAGNLFSVQIIDYLQSQAWINIGSGTSSPIVATIPADLKNKIYKLRVIASAPAVNGSESMESLFVIPDISQTQPSTIVGNATPCPGSNGLRYSINWLDSGSDYHWTVPPGWTIESGQDTTLLTVTAGTTAGFITVTASNSCGTSLTRQMAVNPVSLIPPTATGANRCGLTITAAGGPQGSSYRWYTVATGNAAQPVGLEANFTTPVLTATTTYYVASVWPGGCESTRTAVTATVNQVPEANAGPNLTLCINEAPITLSDFSPAGGIWSGTGVSNNGVFSPATAGLGTHTLTYTIAQNGCSATATKKITVTAAPMVTLAPFINPVCLTNNGYILTGGLPIGGTYSGPGVINGIFNASQVGVGTDTIFYTYAQPGGCAVTVAQPIRATADCPAPDDLAANLGVAPNPTSSGLFVRLPLPAKTDLILRLIDSKGNVVYEQRYIQVMGEFREKLNLSFNAKGIYTLYLILDNTTVAKRVVIQ